MFNLFALEGHAIAEYYGIGWALASPCYPPKPPPVTFFAKLEKAHPHLFGLISKTAETAEVHDDGQDGERFKKRKAGMQAKDDLIDGEEKEKEEGDGGFVDKGVGDQSRPGGKGNSGECQVIMEKCKKATLLRSRPAWDALHLESSELYTPPMALKNENDYVSRKLDGLNYDRSRLGIRDLELWMWRLFLDDLGDFRESLGLIPCPYSDIHDADQLPQTPLSLFGLSPALMSIESLLPQRALLCGAWEYRGFHARLPPYLESFLSNANDCASLQKQERNHLSHVASSPPGFLSSSLSCSRSTPSPSVIYLGFGSMESLGLLDAHAANVVHALDVFMDAKPCLWIVCQVIYSLC